MVKNLFIIVLLLLFTLPCIAGKEDKTKDSEGSIPTVKARYLDKKEDDLFSLSEKYKQNDIEEYEEDLEQDAKDSLVKWGQRFKSISPKEIISNAASTLYQEIYHTGKSIYAKLDTNDTIIILGRSPVPIAFALNYFLQKDEHPKKVNIVDLLYSGTPNIPNIRKDKYDNRRNVLTPKRLDFFESYMDSQGLDKITSSSQRLYIVDQMGTGASMNSFLRILRHYFLTYRKMDELPQLTILLMNFQPGKVHKQEDGSYIFNAKTETLFFNSADKTKDRFRSMMVHAVPLGISDLVVDACEDEVLQSAIKHQFPPFFWSDKYRHLIEEKPSKAEGIETFLFKLFQMAEKEEIRQMIHSSDDGKSASSNTTDVA